MTYFDAHKLLDRVKDGQTFSRVVIDRALFLTGDAPERGQELENENDQTIAESRIVARTFFL
jgi:hypothetical protein